MEVGGVQGVDITDDGTFVRRSSYQPGTRAAIAGVNAYLLGEADPVGVIVTAAWESFKDQFGSAQITEILRGESSALRAIPNFGLIAESDGDIHVVLRGDTQAEVRTGHSMITLTCPISTTIAVYRLSNPPDSVQVSPAGATPEMPALLPFSGGVVPASTLLLAWTSRSDPPPPHSPVEPKLDGAEPDPVQSRASGPPGTALPAPEVVVSANTIHPTPALDDEMPSTASRSTVPSDTSYDHLFGHTINRTVEEAAVRAEEPQPEPPTTVAQSAPPAPDFPPTVAAVEAPPVVTADPAWSEASPVAPPLTEMIDSVPGPSRRPEPAWGNSGPSELTINRAALARQMDAPNALRPVGPSVHAVRCPAGHLNPPHLERCRSCPSVITEQAPISVPRPVLGALRFSSGDEIDLDRSVLIGRSPAPDHLIDGERPHIVQVPSPDQDVSRNHLEVRIDGWHVLVRDLNSTNGTLVIRPGAEPERLRPDVPVMIEPGTSVSIADEIMFTFVAT
jgi:hypothetical protein